MVTYIFLVQHALDLQLAVANILQLLVNSERNQQVLCEACLHQRLLQRCSQALGDEDHPLHPPLQRMFERLASQALQPMALRYWTNIFHLSYLRYYIPEVDTNIKTSPKVIPLSKPCVRLWIPLLLTC